MANHRNVGAPFRRADGSMWERGQDAEPTQEELIKRRYKLRPVEPGERVRPTERDRRAGRLLRKVTPMSSPDEWPLQMSTTRYLQLHPEGPYADLARRLEAPVDVPAKEQRYR